MEVVEEQQKGESVEENNVCFDKDHEEKADKQQQEHDNLLTSAAGSVVNMSSTPRMLASPFRKPLTIDTGQDDEEVAPSSLIPTPPDGGWGWVVVAASFMTNMIVDGITYSFGILLPEFTASLGGTMEMAALIGSLLVGCYLLVGPIVGGLVNRYEARPVMIIGSIIASFAFFISYWADSLVWLMLTFGILGGIGSGLIYLPGVVYVGYYFEKKRALATGISVAGSGFGAFIFPPLTDALVAAFTWRGSMWIFAGIALNCAVFGALMRPLPKPKTVIIMKKKLALSRTNLQNSDLTLNQFYNNKDNVGSNRKLTIRTESGFSHSSGWPSPRNLSHHRQLDAVLASESAVGATADKVSRVGSALGIQAPTLDAVKEEPVAEQREDVTKKRKPEEQSDAVPPDSTLNPSGQINGSLFYESKKHSTISGASFESDDAPIQFNIQGPARKAEQFQMSTAATTTASTSPNNSPRVSRHTSTHVQPPLQSATPMERSNVGSTIDIVRPSVSRMVSRSSRLSIRDFANSLNRLASTNLTSSNGGLVSNLSQATIIDPSEFTTPFARQDILLSGSIQNLPAFKRSGSNLKSYRESIISVPRDVEIYENMIDGSIVAVPQTYEPTCIEIIPAMIRNVLREMLDINLLQHPTMILLCLSNFFGFVAFYVPYVYLTMFAVECGIEKSEAAFFLSVIGITNTIGRVFYGWLSDKGWIRSITVNNLTLTACGIITIFVPIYTTYAWLTIYSALFGFLIGRNSYEISSVVSYHPFKFSAAFVCLTSVILVEHLGLKRLTNAFGLLILVRGFACLIGSPLAGYVYTKTQNYNASFIFSGVLIVLAGVISFCVPMVEKWRLLGKNGKLFDKNGFADFAMDYDDDEVDGRLTANNSRRLDDIVEALAEQEFNREKDASILEFWASSPNLLQGYIYKNSDGCIDQFKVNGVYTRLYHYFRAQFFTCRWKFSSRP